MIVRPIEKKDFETYLKFAKAAGVGMTSLTANKKTLYENLEKSLYSFQKKVTRPEDELYLFVLENLETKEIGGISGIYSKTKERCYYKLEEKEGYHVLHPLCEVSGPSELCSLFILPHFRQLGLGKFLSFSRFLFIASFRERFTKVISAELRGHVDKNISPLWNALGRHLCPMSFKELNQKLHEGQNTLKKSLSEYPLYSFLLPKKAKECLGKPHLHSERALQILIDQGFELTHLINPNDGGPLVQAKIEEIKTIKNSEAAPLFSMDHCPGEEEFFVATTSLEFKAVCCRLKKKQGEVTLSPESAKHLELEINDTIRFIKKRQT